MPDSQPPGGSAGTGSELNLSEWVESSLPALLDAEADWPHQPITGLVADGSPLRQYLDGPDLPPEGTGRAERRQFFDERAAAEAELREDVADAVQLHDRIGHSMHLRKAADGLFLRLARPKGSSGTKPEPRSPVSGPLGSW